MKIAAIIATILVTLCISFASGVLGADDTLQLLVEQSDPTSDWLTPTPNPSYMDIVWTRVFLGPSMRLHFEMQLAGSVPETPESWMFFGWFIDTDLDATTGQPYNDIGSDYNAQIDYSTDLGWHGLLYKIGEGVVSLRRLSVQGDTLSLVVPLYELDHPKVIRWISIDQREGSFYNDVAPNEGSVFIEL